MENKEIMLTESEWSVMKCLWESLPRTGRELTDILAEEEGWSRSTVLTFLKRLEDKGAVISDMDSGVKLFSPLAKQEDVALREAENLIKKAYKGSISMLLSAFTKKQTLSREEIDELYDIIQQAEEGGQR